MQYKLIGGIFKYKSRIYKAGDVIDTHIHLDKVFRGKFVKDKGAEPSQGAPVRKKPPIVGPPLKGEESTATTDSSLSKEVKNDFSVGNRVKVDFEEGSFLGTITSVKKKGVIVLFDDETTESVLFEDLILEDKTITDEELSKKHGKDVTREYPKAKKAGVRIFTRNGYILIVDKVDGQILNEKKMHGQDVNSFLEQLLE